MNSVPVISSVPRIPAARLDRTVATLPRRSPPPRRRRLGVPDQFVRLTAVVTRDAGVVLARALEVDVASQGPTVDDALANLRDELELYFEAKPVPASVNDELIVAQVDVAVPW
jgi:hypothetical protein